MGGMTRTILGSKTFDPDLKKLASAAAKMLDADFCSILRWDSGQKQLVHLVSTSNGRSSLCLPDKLESRLGISALKKGTVIAIEDLADLTQFKSDPQKKSSVRSVLAIPLIGKDQKLGAALVAYEKPQHFSSKDIENGQRAGDQIALALWSLRQSQVIERRLKESSALAEIGYALSQNERGGTDRVLQLIVDSARELIPQAEESVIHLLDSEEPALIARAVSGIADAENRKGHVQMRLGVGVAGQVIRQGVTINIGDIEADPRFVRLESGVRFRSLMVAPVRGGDKPLGTISVQSNMPNAFSEIENHILSTLGTQAAIAIENARLLEATEKGLQEVNALYRISQGLATSLDPEELLKEAVELLHDNFGYYHVQVLVIDEGSRDLVMRQGSGEIGARLKEKGHRIHPGAGIVGKVVETGQPFVANHVDEVGFYLPNPSLPDTRSELGVPIKIDGLVAGVLDIQQVSSRKLTERDVQLVSAVADQLGVALQKANLYSDLQTSMRQELAIRKQLIQTERLALVGRLLASVAHELNNPLQAIQNAIFLVKEEEGISEQGQQDLAIILSETNRLVNLIDRLRDTYRPVLSEEFRRIQLNEIVKNVHALTATQRVPEKDEILLSVSDTGTGIDLTLLPGIFDPFVTSKESGTGLGLSISHSIVERHSGRIQAVNNPDGGATLMVWLPMHPQEAQ